MKENCREIMMSLVGVWVAEVTGKVVKTLSLVSCGILHMLKVFYLRPNCILICSVITRT